jgi:hypothetical protein
MKNILITALTCIVVAGCAAPVSNTFAPAMLQTSSLPEQLRPSETEAKVFFVPGRTGSKYGLKVSMVPGAQFLINGNMVGQIGRDTALAINIVPGSYSFAWRYPSADARLNFVQAQLNAGDVLILQADYMFQFIGPADYQLTSISDLGAVLGKQIIGPVGCPTTICK